MKTQPTSKKLSPEIYAERLWLRTKKIFKEFHLARQNSPLVIMSVSNLTFLSFLGSFLEVLTKEKNIDFLKKVIKEYSQLIKREFPGEIAYVRSAAHLTEEEKTVLNERLAAIFGRYFHLVVEIDPELIGGLVIEVEGKILDESVLGKMKELGQHLNL